MKYLKFKNSASGLIEYNLIERMVENPCNKTRGNEHTVTCLITHGGYAVFAGEKDVTWFLQQLGEPGDVIDCTFLDSVIWGKRLDVI